jgi:hypothetical protein
VTTSRITLSAGLLTALALTAGMGTATPPPTKKSAGKAPVPTYTGGYTHAAQLNYYRRRVLQGGYAAAPAAAAVRPASGTRSIAAICVDYADLHGPFPKEKYQDLLFGAPGSGAPEASLAQYFKDVSGGRLNVGGRVVGWYQLPDGADHYKADPARLGELLKAALEKADADIDFAQFDNDGPDGVPNSGDDDGKVDCVFIIHPEAGAESGKPGTEGNFRSMFGRYSDPKFGFGKPFVTRAIKKGRDGKPEVNPDGSPRHIVIDEFTIQAGLSAPLDPQDATDAAAKAKKMVRLGLFCHEYGHVLGVPDLYDRNYDGNFGSGSWGIGGWCLMSYGMYGPDGEATDRPVHPSAWVKLYLGWANVRTITASGPVDLEPVEQGNRIYRIDVGVPGGSEYFLFEYRDKNWRDTRPHPPINWDAGLPTSGVAIWHVDETVGHDSPTWPFTLLTQGQNDAPSQNLGTPHALVALVQADGALQLERGQPPNMQDWYEAHSKQLFVSATNFDDDPTFRKGSRAYGQKASGIALRQIDLGGKKLEAVVPGPPLVSAPPGPPATTAAAPVRTRGLPGPHQPPPHQPPQHTPAPRPPTRAGAGPVGTHVPALPPAPGHASPATQPLATRLEELAKTGSFPADAGTVLRHLTDAEKTALRTLPNCDLHVAVDPQLLPAVKAAAAQLRTQTYDTNSVPMNATEKALVDLLKRQEGARPIQVQYCPGHFYVQRITGWKLPASKPTVAEDADALIGGVLKPLIGEGTTLGQGATVEPAAGTGTIRRYQQVKSLGGEQLPVFDKEVNLYYDKGSRLTALTSDLVGSLTVGGQSGDLTAEQAKALAANAIGVSEKLVRDAQPGLYLINDDPRQARVSFEVRVRSGEQDVRVFVDNETRKVLDIK